MAKRQIAPMRAPIMRTLFAGAALTTLGALTGCGNLDFDLRNNFGKGAPGTSDAARQATAPRPKADDRGIISYPNYQVAVARRDDTVATVASRVGLDANELARYNGVKPDAKLRNGEIIALPRRVSEPSLATGAVTTGPLQPEPVDITTLAGGAIVRAGNGSAATTTPTTPSGIEPIRHKVERGETAYSISRLYNVSVRSLAEWNGLGANLSVRDGQYLLIPVATGGATAAATTQPGSGTPTPVPPSSTQPLPAEKTSATPAPAPVSPNLGGQSSASSSNARLLYPVQGNIIRAYSSKSDGIDIAAKAGTSIKAADAGTVAAITRDTDQVPILVIRHKDNLLTIYANVDSITVKKGDRVSRGQSIAKVRAASPSFVHFEVRKDFDSVDPIPYLE